MNKELDQFVEELDDSRVTIVVEGNGWGAVCHPDICGEEVIKSRSEPPFNFRVFGDAPSTETVATLLSEKFYEKAEEVYQKIGDSDDALETLLDITDVSSRSTVEDL